jgi:hypothetical protein
MILRTLVVICAVIISANLAVGQSGRRVPKKPDPPSNPRLEPQPPVKAAEPEIPKIPLLLVFGGSSVTSDLFLNRVAVESCEKRLKDSSALAVRTGKEMNRGQASDYAKSMNQHVASLEVEQERAGLSPSRVGLDDISIRYYVFTPGTGKTKSSGRVYLRPPRTGVGLPLPAPRSPVVIQYAVEEAGREAAERIINALGLALPPRPR